MRGTSRPRWQPKVKAVSVVRALKHITVADATLRNCNCDDISSSQSTAFAYCASNPFKTSSFLHSPKWSLKFYAISDWAFNTEYTASTTT